jgi:hypothetical protein
MSYIRYKMIIDRLGVAAYTPGNIEQMTDTADFQG